MGRRSENEFETFFSDLGRAIEVGFKRVAEDLKKSNKDTKNAFDRLEKDFKTFGNNIEKLVSDALSPSKNTEQDHLRADYEAQIGVLVGQTIAKLIADQPTLEKFIATPEGYEAVHQHTENYVRAIIQAKRDQTELPSHDEYRKKLADILIENRFSPKSDNQSDDSKSAKLEDAENLPEATPTIARMPSNSTLRSSIRSITSQYQHDHQRLSGRHLNRKSPLIANETLPPGFHTLSDKEREDLERQQNLKDTLELAQETAVLSEAAKDVAELLEEQNEQLEHADKTVQQADQSTERAVKHLEEAQKTQQEVIRMKLMIATIACGAVSVGCAGWLLQSLGSSGYLTIAAIVVTTLAVAATATCGGLFAVKQKQAKAQQAGQDSNTTKSPEAGNGP